MGTEVTSCLVSSDPPRVKSGAFTFLHITTVGLQSLWQCPEGPPWRGVVLGVTLMPPDRTEPTI